MESGNFLTQPDVKVLDYMRDITGREPEVAYDNDSVVLSARIDGMDARAVRTLKSGIRWRVRYRLIEWKEVNGWLSYRLRYSLTSKRVESADTKKERRHPKSGTPYRYKAQNIAVWAMEFSRENVDALRKFTGGGNLTVPKGRRAPLLYTFLNHKGKEVTAEEGEFIFFRPNGRIYKMAHALFLRAFALMA